MAKKHDWLRGIYKTFYSIWLTGQRINTVSDRAECLFFRLHFVCDDFGVGHASPDLLKAGAAPRKTWTHRQIEKAMSELVKAGLAKTYTAKGELYFWLIDYTTFQPAMGENNKRVAKHPQPPDMPKVPQGSARSLKVPQDSAKSLKVPQGLSGSCKGQYEQEQDQDNQYEYEDKDQDQSEPRGNVEGALTSLGIDGKKFEQLSGLTDLTEREVHRAHRTARDKKARDPAKYVIGILLTARGQDVRTKLGIKNDMDATMARLTQARKDKGVPNV